MRRIQTGVTFAIVSLVALTMSSCTSMSGSDLKKVAVNQPEASSNTNYASRIPSHIATSEKVVVVDPRVHVWGAYAADGHLVRAGLTTAGSNWCPDLGRPCRTKIGTFRVNSLGSPGCKSSLFPRPHGGAPMPYCMYFHGGQALHGSGFNQVIEGNASHGCVRMRVDDAAWLRYNFVNVGTKVVIKPY